MSWTDEKVNKLKELCGKGNTASQIAQIIGGITRNAVIGKAHRLNLSAKIKTRAAASNQTFETSRFVICSFCPRLYDYHPESIPAPYNHSNIDSDEVLYYVDGDFMSRNHVEEGYISLHPAGIPHGPHPGAMERSVGQTKTDELAVMVDTFAPLQLTKAAIELSDGKYHKSWIE